MSKKATQRRTGTAKQRASSIKTPFPDGLAQPALRALANAGYDHLDQLAAVSEGKIRDLHGIGPNALKKLREALANAGLAFSQSAPDDDVIGDYISQFAPDVQLILEQVRKTIRKAAPDATEVISYQMPAFKQHGILIYFAAWKNHIGLYPPILGDPTLEQAVARYAGPKGNLQFPLDEPIPYDLIERLVKLRVTQDAARAAAKHKRKS